MFCPWGPKWGREFYFVYLSRKANPLLDEVESLEGPHKPKKNPKPQNVSPGHPKWRMESYFVCFPIKLTISRLSRELKFGRLIEGAPKPNGKRKLGKSGQGSFEMGDGKCIVLQYSWRRWPRRET
jgi:hypothetical protein